MDSWTWLTFRQKIICEMIFFFFVSSALSVCSCSDSPDNSLTCLVEAVLCASRVLMILSVQNRCTGTQTRTHTHTMAHKMPKTDHYFFTRANSQRLLSVVVSFHVCVKVVAWATDSQRCNSIRIFHLQMLYCVCVCVLLSQL